MHPRAGGGDYYGHRAPPRLTREVLLGLYTAYSRDHGVDCALQWLEPKPQTGGLDHHPTDDLCPPHFSEGPQVTPQRRVGKALPSRNCTARIRGVTVMTITGRARHKGPLALGGPLSALRGPHAPPGRPVVSARLPPGVHATSPSVARASIPGSLCTGNLGYPKGPAHARGGGHLP